MKFRISIWIFYARLWLDAFFAAIVLLLLSYSIFVCLFSRFSFRRIFLHLSISLAMTFFRQFRAAFHRIHTEWGELSWKCHFVTKHEGCEQEKSRKCRTQIIQRSYFAGDPATIRTVELSTVRFIFKRSPFIFVPFGISRETVQSNEWNDGSDRVDVWNEQSTKTWKRS